jgi:hypothetical protein
MNEYELNTGGGKLTSFLYEYIHIKRKYIPYISNCDKLKVNQNRDILNFVSILDIKLSHVFIESL